MSKNNKKQLDINKFYYQLASLNTILIILSFPLIILFYYKPKNILLTIFILNILLIINFYIFNIYMMSKEIKSQLNILNFILILCFMISISFLYKINNKYFKQVCVLLIINIVIYALINTYTKSQKTLLKLISFYTIYVFFTTVGIFMLTQENQPSNKTPPGRPHDDFNP